MLRLTRCHNKKVCTYPISWTYADKLHTFHNMLYLKNEQPNWIYASLLLVQELLYFPFSKMSNENLLYFVMKIFFILF